MVPFSPLPTQPMGVRLKEGRQSMSCWYNAVASGSCLASCSGIWNFMNWLALSKPPKGMADLAEQGERIMKHPPPNVTEHLQYKVGASREWGPVTRSFSLSPLSIAPTQSSCTSCSSCSSCFSCSGTFASRFGRRHRGPSPTMHPERLQSNLFADEMTTDVYHVTSSNLTSQRGNKLLEMNLSTRFCLLLNILEPLFFNRESSSSMMSLGVRIFVPRSNSDASGSESNSRFKRDVSALRFHPFPSEAVVSPRGNTQPHRAIQV
ncbi:hypothetical protein EYF80_026049 [Liparis tanakae]|uniref:Uncharacterized protein n=1 Tax=Liparis tanakae TaxID=230148 RepID=A0A4Z2HFY9_9TELE|nr:hypothetical protein EYF80_026049 [Liparis tanakae]